jgi:diacylglycerol kinase family enzyme
MDRMKVILNPKAGRWYGDKIEPELRQYLQDEGLDFDLVRTEGQSTPRN